MNAQARKKSAPARGIRGWLVPLGIVLVAGLLITFVVLQNKPVDAAPAAVSTPTSEATQPSSGASAPPAASEAPAAPPEQPDFRRFETRDAADVQAIGPVDAPIALVVYSDYQCRFCARWTHDTLPTIMEYVNAGDLRIEWRDVIFYGDPSERAALAAHAAGIQGKFWEFHDALYPEGEHRSEGQLSKDALVALAGSLGLDTAKFAADMDDPATKTLINQYAQVGRDLGVTATPSFLLDGKPIVGAQPTSVFVDAIAAALAAAPQ